MEEYTITYLGQCGFIIAGDQVSVAIDPVLNDLCDDDGNDIRLYPPVMSGYELDVDYVLCTHEHIDHMAIETIVANEKTHPTTKYIVPTGCVKFLKAAGIGDEKIIRMKDAEEISLKDGALIVKATQTAHPIHQLDAEGLEMSLAYDMIIDGVSFVHLGDTYLTDRLKKGLEAFDEIDVIFAPINGRDEERDAKGIIGNLSYEEAANLSHELSAKVAIPMHYDMVAGNTEDPNKFVKALLSLDDKNGYWIPSFDEDFIFTRS